MQVRNKKILHSYNNVLIAQKQHIHKETTFITKHQQLGEEGRQLLELL